MVNKQEFSNVLLNFSKFEKSRRELMRGTAKLEQMYSSNISERFYCLYGKIYYDNKMTKEFYLKASLYVLISFSFSTESSTQTSLCE